MALRKTLPRAQWNPFHFWFLNKQNKEKRLILNNFPDDLLLLYRSTDGLKAALGPISWDGTPVITADGVAAGHGPDMGAVNRASRKVCVVRFKATKASTGITGDEQVFGPLYLRNGNLVGKLDGQEDTFAHTWAIGDEISAVVEMTPSGVTVQLVGGLE